MNTTQTVLIIGFVWPEPTSSAAGSRMIQLMALFKSLHFNIVFASAALRSDHSVSLSRIGIQEREILLNSDTFDLFVKDLDPTIVIFDRFMVEEQYGWRVAEHCPSALRILDSEDLHCLRKARHAALKQHTVFDITSLSSHEVAKREIASIYRCDLTLIISEFEMTLLKDQFNISSELLYYLPLFVESLDVPPRAFEQREGFVFIGNFWHEPNKDAVLYLKNTIWPLIRAQIKAAIHIYGAYMPQQIMDLHNPSQGFLVHGRAASSVEAIGIHRVMLAPIRFGAGIKGKLLEAMQCGTASVTTEIGAEGMNGDFAWNGTIADNPEEFANAAVALYTDDSTWKQAQQNGTQIIIKRFNKLDFIPDLQHRLAELQQNLMAHRQANFIGAMLQFHTMRSTEFMSRWIEAKTNKKPAD